MDGKWDKWWMVPVLTLFAVLTTVMLRWRAILLGFALVFVIFALTGCKTVPEVVEVRVAVPVACQIAEPERPLMPTDELDPAAPVDLQARYLRAEIEIREGYEDRLLTALRGCRKPITQ